MTARAVAPQEARAAGPRPREALLALGARLQAFPLALVVAPAGSGKSTLLGAWRRELRARQVTASYLDLAPVHADPALLAGDLVASIGSGIPGFGDETRRVLGNLPGGSEDWRLVLRALLREWGEEPVPLCCFLDNYHHLGSDSPADRFLSELLRASPPHLHLVVASRGAVPGATARMRAADAVLEVGADDLNLRADEVAAVLAQGGIHDDPALAARLLARTEGWATGVQLAARRLASVAPADRGEYLSRLGREADLFGFVAAEVLQGERDEVVEILEVVSLLGRSTPDEIGLASGDPRAREWLGGAAERGLLQTDGREMWVHQLWHEFLRDRTRGRLGADGYRALVLRTAQTLGERGRFEAALALFSDIGEWGRVSELMLEAGPRWLAGRDIERVRHWLNRLPEAEIEANPGLLAQLGVATMRREPARATKHLQRAAELYAAAGNREAEQGLLVFLGVLALTQHQQEAARRAIRRMISLVRLIKSRADRGAVLVLLAGFRLLTGRFERSLRLSERAAGMGLEPAVEWFNSMNLVLLRLLRGETESAMRTVDAMFERPEVDANAFFHFSLRLQRARVLTVIGDYDRARVDAQSADEAFADHRGGVLREIPAFVLAQVESRSGNLDEARRWFDEAVSRTREGENQGIEGMVRASFSIELLRWGDVDEAGREAARAVELLTDPSGRGGRLWPWWLVYALCVLGRAVDPEEAWLVASRHRASFRDKGLGMTWHGMQLALFDLAERAGQGDEAERIGRDAWSHAARAGLRQLCPHMGALLAPVAGARALRDGVEPDYVLERLRETCPAAVPALLDEMLGDRTAGVRERAVGLLARVGGREVHAPLRRATKDRNARVRDAAAKALAGLDLRPRFSLRVTSLGALDVARDDQVVATEAWKGRTSRRLLGRLLAAEGRPLSRDRLLDDLWPDADPESGRNNLRVATSRLNDLLDPNRPQGAGAHFIVAEGDTLALHADALASWDVATFDAELREAEAAEQRGEDARALTRYREALARYAGPFLPEIDDAWVMPVRRRLAERFVSVGHRVGPRFVRRGRLADAAMLADRLLDEDVADEQAWELRMRTQLARHDRTGALRTYGDAVDALRRELDLDPGESLARLAAEARGR